MIPTMKPLILSTALVVFLACACKLETSSATGDGNANTSANAYANQGAEARNTNAQEPKSNCSLAAATIPLIEGIKLGSTADEVLTILPGSKDDDEAKTAIAKPATALGVSEFIVRANKLQSKEKYAHINHFTFSLLDGRISTINIGYNGPAYANVDEFVTNFVKGTNLPPVEQWEAYPGLETQLKTLTCKDFEIRMFSGGDNGNQNYVLLTDLEAKKKLKERRAKARAQASPTP